MIKEICCARRRYPLQISCFEDGRDVELKFVDVKNSIPKTLNISDLSTIDSVVVEIVYRSNPLMLH
ncbi:MAG: hypothetical protein R2788_03610 [Saprospiraceae bacterium]